MGNICVCLCVCHITFICIQRWLRHCKVLVRSQRSAEGPSSVWIMVRLYPTNMWRRDTFLLLTLVVCWVHGFSFHFHLWCPLLFSWEQQWHIHGGKLACDRWKWDLMSVMCHWWRFMNDCGIRSLSHCFPWVCPSWPQALCVCTVAICITGNNENFVKYKQILSRSIPCCTFFLLWCLSPF